MNSKKKVYFLINSLNMGGAERTISNIVPYLKKDFDITVLTLKNTDIFFKLDVPIINLSSAKNNWSMLLNVPAIVVKLKKLLKSNPDARLVSFLDLSNIVATLACNHAIISFRNSPSLYSPISRFLRGLVMKVVYSRAKYIVVNSEENRYLISEWLNYPLDKIKRIYNPFLISNSKIKDETGMSFPGYSKDAKVFVTVSRLEKIKNVDLLVKAIVQYKRINPNCIFWIIGDGPQRGSLIDLVKSSEAQKYIFLLGSQKNVFSYLRKADVFIYASSTEGFPNVLLEATAMGLPIITTNFSSGSREVIDPKLEISKKIELPYYGPNGVLVDFHKVDKQLLAILDKKITQKKAGLERFEISKVTDLWRKILH